MENVSQAFVKKLYDMTGEVFEQRITEKARECFADYLFVTLAGCTTYKNRYESYLTENRVKGDCRVFGQSLTADIRTAAMINAFSAHVLELDDSHRVAMTHLGAPIFSALLAVAEAYERSTDDLLHAAVVGYEAAVRLANAVQPGHKKRGFHVSGTCCTVGCAMGIASMLRFSEEEMRNVLSAAVTSAAGLLGVASGSSEQKPYNTANAAAAGVSAALYGRYFTGADDILNGARGFFEAETDAARPAQLFAEGYAIEGIYQKLYAACRHCHAPMEAMLKMRGSAGISADNVERIEVQTYDLAIAGHDHTVISGISAAKQSIPYGVTAACLYGDCGPEAFTEERVFAPQAAALIKKVTVREDPALTALVPSKRAAVVTVTLKDGTQLSERVEYAKGEPENPITKEEFEQKFLGLSHRADLTHEQVRGMIHEIQTCGSEPVGALLRQLHL